MAGAVDALSSLVPLLAAPELFDYPQFVSVKTPENSGAVAAYEGYIRPFSDDQTARHVLRAIDAGEPLQIVGGRLHVDASHLRRHPFEDFLADMTLPCTTLVLDFEGTEHPRAFLTKPVMLPKLSQCPHIRPDKSVMIDGRLQPALCVYSGSLFRYMPDGSRLEQFLDQVATYLAKYLIWLKTRMLFRDFPWVGRQFVYRRKPNEPVTNLDLFESPSVYWDGYWSGQSAPAGTAAHLATINRRDECWCWSGKPYQECCRPKEFMQIEKIRLPPN
jgi:hypothetical protein